MSLCLYVGVCLNGTQGDCVCLAFYIVFSVSYSSIITPLITIESESISENDKGLSFKFGLCLCFQVCVSV